MAYSNTGLFRVNKIKCKECKKGYRYSYQMKTELLKIDIRKTNILDLKQAVLEAGLLWGITDIEKATYTAIENGITINELAGRYGKLGRESK